ncbi:gamma-aminobutyric acid type B receptor subunit 2-like [Amphiura filiformis]|uniref:gamma-aminobutyric acid type B receptor subunit 2-like n=1 Tax=Amphiura filiformis TaxID=82378 RepID=UPI003B21D79A
MKTNITRDKVGIELYVSQYRDEQLEIVAYFDNNGENPTWANGNASHSIKWRGNLVPVDGKTFNRHYVVPGDISKIVMCTFTSLGIFMGIIFLLINTSRRKEKAIKITSPTLNNFIAIGCILLYSSVYVWSVEHSDLADMAIATLCYIQYICVVMGFNLCMGALFMKTYRVHTIFRATFKAIKVDLHDNDLICWIVAIIALDAVIISLWLALDKLYVVEFGLTPQFDSEDPDQEIYNIQVIRKCKSGYQPAFFSALAVTKLIMLTFGVFLAWKTRNVTIAALNDSKYIAASVYTIAVVVTLLLPSLVMTANDVDTQFLCYASAIIIVITTVLLLVFLPKMVILWKHRTGTTLNTSILASSLSTGTSISSDQCPNLHMLDLQLAAKTEELQHVLSQLTGYSGAADVNYRQRSVQC